ncbi:MAG TPA: peptidylprolyl isomerase [Crenalkalicoccus sp.]|nr:peptidylprolyl isomerase [Crenalkalicoccus sp.]
MRRRSFAAGLAAGGLLALPALGRAQGTAQGTGGERLELQVGDAQQRPKGGPILIQLLPDIAPKHVERIRILTQRGFYDGTPFHRVIEGFMAQGGDPTGTGTGGSDLPNLPAEFTAQYRFVRGICGMARSQDPNSANSQFFIMFGPMPSLDRNYTIWGRVVAGMDSVDAIKKGDPARNGLVQNPDRLLRARLGTT